MGNRIEKNTMDIPTEMEEILYKLPVKSLLRFKCISKSWRSLISDKYFIKQHLKKSSTNDDNTADSSHHNNLIFSFKYRPTNSISLGSCSLLCKEPVIKPNIDDFPTEIPRSSFEIVGSCNGLVLIKVSDVNKLVLWNPSTRQVYKNIPVSYYEAQFRTNLSGFMFLPNFLYGFGYDESKDEYKVVCIKVTTVHKPNETVIPNETLMYSSKTGSWKKIGNFDKGTFRSFSSAKFVNGRFHWLARDLPGWPGTYNIVSLDLLQEKYETVARPNCMSNYSDYSQYLKLEDLGGYLSVVSVTHRPRVYSDVSVWAMMEYDKSESWTKIWTLADFVVDPIERSSRNAILMPLWLKKNGDVAVAFGSDIVVYNGKNEVRKYRVDLLDHDARINFILYLESLVSPFVDDR